MQRYELSFPTAHTSCFDFSKDVENSILDEKLHQIPVLDWHSKGTFVHFLIIKRIFPQNLLLVGPDPLALLHLILAKIAQSTKRHMHELDSGPWSAIDGLINTH